MHTLSCRPRSLHCAQLSSHALPGDKAGQRGHSGFAQEPRGPASCPTCFHPISAAGHGPVPSWRTISAVRALNGDGQLRKDQKSEGRERFLPGQEGMLECHPSRDPRAPRPAQPSLCSLHVLYFEGWPADTTATPKLNRCLKHEMREGHKILI